MDATDTPQMGACLRQACKQARVAADISPGKVAVEHRPEIKQGQTITDWEEGEINWPSDPDERVRAYAELTGVPAWELWQRAIDLWRASLSEGDDRDLLVGGHPPTFPQLTEPDTSAEDHRQAGS